MDSDSLNAVIDYRNSRLQWHSHAKSNLSRQELAILRKGISSSRDPFENFRGIFERYQRHDPVNQQMIVDFETYLPEQILTMMDRATMAASIEGRVPFLDNALVDFAFSLPAKIKMGKPPETKRVLKRAIAKDVPAAVLSRRKLGMPSPFMSLLAGNFAVIRQILLASGSFVRSVLPEEWLRAITRDDVSARQNFRALYAILTLEIWHKLFIREGIYSKPEMSCLDLFEIAGSTALK
jgi:asparagine synthase (glutamine-hydrolysing)